MPDNSPHRYHRAFEVYKGNCPRSTFYLMVERREIELIKVGRRSYCAETWDQIIERLGRAKPKGERPIAKRRQPEEQRAAVK